MAKHEAPPVVRRSITDVDLPAAVIGLLPPGEMNPGVHDTAVVLDQAFVLYRSRVRVPLIPKGAPQGFTFRSGRRFPGLQFLRWGDMAQVQVYRPFIRVQQGDEVFEGFVQLSVLVLRSK